MSLTAWLDYLKSAEKSSIIHHEVRKVLYKFPDGAEMMEEYSMSTGIILKRAWKKRRDMLTFSPSDTGIGDGHFSWEFELGDFTRPLRDSEFLVKESSTEPILTKRITKTKIEWRIRNLPYPKEVYKVTAEADKKAIVVRTENKKYFKSIEVPELDRCQLQLEQKNLSIDYKYNTLIILYEKPQPVIQMEAEVLKLLQDVETEVDEEEDVDAMRKIFKMVK